MWRRIKNLWKLSGINMDGDEFTERDTYRKKVINKITDVYIGNRTPWENKNPQKLATIIDLSAPDNPVDAEIK